MLFNHFSIFAASKKQSLTHDLGSFLLVASNTFQRAPANSVEVRSMFNSVPRTLAELVVVQQL